MIINYDIQKINQMLKDFYNATGINMDLLKADFSYVGNRNFWENKKYCKAIQSTESGKKACLCSDSCLLNESRASKMPQMHVCHAGLVDVSVPVLYNDIIIGYVIFGQLKTNNDFSKIEKSLKNFELNIEELKEYYSELPLFTEEQIQSISIIAKMLVKHILLENMLKPFDENIGRVISYINENLDTDLTIHSISKIANISKSVLYRNFHNYFGCTVGQYINRKRIEKAVELLTDNNLSIEEIAIRTGFSDGSYFSKIFKKEKGLSPLKYKNTLKNK